MSTSMMQQQPAADGAHGQPRPVAQRGAQRRGAAARLFPEGSSTTKPWAATPSQAHCDERRRRNIADVARQYGPASASGYHDLRAALTSARTVKAPAPALAATCIGELRFVVPGTNIPETLCWEPLPPPTLEPAAPLALEQAITSTSFEDISATETATTATTSTVEAAPLDPTSPSTSAEAAPSGLRVFRRNDSANEGDGEGGAEPKACCSGEEAACSGRVIIARGGAIVSHPIHLCCEEQEVEAAPAPAKRAKRGARLLSAGLRAVGGLLLGGGTLRELLAGGC